MREVTEQRERERERDKERERERERDREKKREVAEGVVIAWALDTDSY